MFDVDGARKAGYSDAEIAQHLAKQSGFDMAGAKKAGYADADIVAHLAPSKPKERSLGTELTRELIASVPGGIVRGIKDVIDTGAEFVSRLGGADEAARVRTMNESGKRDFQSAVDSTPMGWAAHGGRIAGNVLATAPVVSAAGAGLMAAGLPRLGAALSSGGMATGANPVGAAARAADMGIRVAGGAAGGGMAAGMIDPESASTGAIVGGVLPPVVAGLGAAGRKIGTGLSATRAALTERGARDAAVRRIGDAAGNDARQIVGDLQTYYPKGAEGIPVSAAGITRNPALGRMEQGSRLRNPETWMGFDNEQAAAVYQNVLRATEEAGELGARKVARQANWADNWSKAEGSLKPRNFRSLMGQLKGALDQAAASPESSNPAVLSVLKAIDNEVGRVGEGFNIGHLQQIRANLSGKVSPNSPDAFKAAPRDNPAVITLIQELDDILNKSTGGKWNKVRQGYAADTQAVHESKAAQIVRDKFSDEWTGRIRGTARGDGVTPSVTEAGLGRAMDAARLPDKSLALSGGADQRLNATLEALRRQNFVQQLKRSSTAGGGSDTVSNALALEAAKRGGGNALMQVFDAVGRIGTSRRDNVIAGLLSDPNALAAALDELITRPVSVGYGPAMNALAARSAPALVANR